MVRTRYFLLCIALLPLRVESAGNDDNVEWLGVYSDSSFRTPARPARGEAFDVELRVFRGDISAARLRMWTGEERYFDLSWDRNEGANYDVWKARVSGIDADLLYYYFEIRDGDDTDYYNSLGMFGSSPGRGDFRVDLTPFGRYELGATWMGDVRADPAFPGRGVIFRVWAPNADSGSVAGSFNDWSGSRHRMVRNGGVWQVHVLEADVGDEYKFVFDGDIWRTDPRAQAQVSSVGNSIVYRRSSFSWGDENWQTPYFEDMIIYELHVGTFSGEGDGVNQHPARFQQAIDRHLDDLVELGINMVQLMPVSEFAGERSWGYNPSFLYAVEQTYGGPDGLKYFVDHCHRRGIGVLLDVVYNHMGGSDLAGNLLDFDGEEIYFYPLGSPYRDTPWGPRLDYGRRDVRDYIRDNIRFWLEEFHLDGFRLDGTAFMNINAEGWQLLQEIAEVTDTVSRKAIVIAEHLPNDPAVTRPLVEGGAGIDAQWNDQFHDRLREAIRSAAFGDPNMAALANGVNHFDLGGGTQVVNYIESHDEVAVHGRVTVEADGTDPESQWAMGRSKVAAALVFFSAGIPMILQGQEFMESRGFGDDREHRIRWNLIDRNVCFYDFMKDCISLRRTLPALRSDGMQNVFHVNDGAEVIALQRWTASGDDLVIVISLGNDDATGYELGFPLAGDWFEILNGDSEHYCGRNRGNGGRIRADGRALHGFGQSASLTIPRMAVLVFAREPLPQGDRVAFLRADCNGDGGVDLSDAVRGLGVLFLGSEAVPCTAACDANDDAAMDVSDAVFSLNYLFLGGLPPTAPFPACDDYEGPSALECKQSCAP